MLPLFGLFLPSFVKSFYFPYFFLLYKIRQSNNPGLCKYRKTLHFGLTLLESLFFQYIFIISLSFILITKNNN